MRVLLSSLAFIAVLPAGGAAQASCDLKGVWQLVSSKVGGEVGPANYRQMKIITDGHFAFVGETDRGVKEMKSAADSLAAFRTMGSGGGTYMLRGTTYTEKLEYFSDPAYLGMSIAFSCRTEGNQFFQTGTFPVMEGGKKVREVTLEEVWRRIEKL